MANNTYVNKVVFGNDTLLDLTSDTVTANDVKSGVTFHDKTGAPLIGQFSPASITPSNTSPDSLTSGNIVEPTEDGYAIKSYADLTPSNTSPVLLSPKRMYRTDPLATVSVGYAIRSLRVITPSDSSPVQVSNNDICKINNSSGGYVYENLQEETETTLWENSSPTSNFNQQVVDLTKNGVAESYTNYKRIRFYYRQSTSNDETAYVDYAKEIIDAWPLQGASISNICALGALPHSAGAFAQIRQIRRGSANPTTSFWISISYRVNASANNQNCGIPTKITGIK